MRISFLPVYKTNFKGIIPPYINQNGYEIIPISINPTQEDIDNAIKTTKNTSSSFDGRNGKAYMWGQDLVVKKYMPKETAINYNPRREIDILDSMYEKKIQHKNIQQGLYAFKAPNGEFYLISNQIHGVHPHRSTDCFTKKNLEELVLTLQKLDEGIIETKDKVATPRLLRIMHNDLSMANVKVTEDSAGILDFEYMDYRDTTDITDKAKEKRLQGSVIMNLSEVTLLPSNLKDFEYRTLAQYLKKADNPKEIFKYYLEAKSKYLEKMGEFYKECSQNPNFKDIAFDFIKTSRKMQNYAQLLQNATKTQDVAILKAEAIKIQIADFLYLMTPYSNTRKFNPAQLKSYIDYAESYFTNGYKEAAETNDDLKAQYYLDCLELLKNWEKVKDKIDKKLKMPEQEDFTPEQIEKGDFAYAQKAHHKFLAKTTSENQITIDEIIE